MPTNNAEALRALADRIEGLLTAVGRHEEREEREERDAIASELRALASQPQAAGVGGDAVAIMAEAARLRGRLTFGAVKHGTTDEYLIVERPVRDDVVALLDRIVDALAATPARAVDVTDPRYEAGFKAGIAFAEEHFTPPAEARDPEPRGAVDDEGLILVPESLWNELDAKAREWKARALDAEAKIAAHQAQGAAVDEAHVFNCARCPVSVVACWQPPHCPECGDPCALDPTAKPSPTPARSGEDVRCVHCGQPTMHMGSACYGCTQSARTATPRPDEGKQA